MQADLLELQTFAVETRYEDGSFHLPAEREQLLRQIEALERNCQAAIDAAA